MTLLGLVTDSAKEQDMSVRNYPILGDSLICMAMWLNGARTNTLNKVIRLRILSRHTMIINESIAAVVGSIEHRIAAPLYDRAFQRVTKIAT